MSGPAGVVRILLFVQAGIAGLLALLELVEAAEYGVVSLGLLALVTLVAGAAAVTAGVLLPQRREWFERALLTGAGGMTGLAVASALFNSATQSPGKALLAAALAGVAGTTAGLSLAPAMQGWWSGQEPAPRSGFPGQPPGWPVGPPQPPQPSTYAPGTYAAPPYAPQPQPPYAPQPQPQPQPNHPPPPPSGGSVPPPPPPWQTPPAGPPGSSA